MTMGNKANMTPGKKAAWRATAEALSCSRTMEEQLVWIQRFGNHGATPALRAGVLAAHGIPKAQPEAENCIIFGCYRPFTTPLLLHAYIRLLDILQINFTYLEEEYCCGAPLAMLATETQLPDMLAAGREFHRHNRNLARTKGATTLAYCCTGCVHAARDTFQDTSTQHLYIVDLILDRLERQALKTTPARIGYFSGCHSFVRTIYPDATLDWGRYRQRLTEIDGLTVVDLPDYCCKLAADGIIAQAGEMGLEAIVCPCNWCYSGLAQAAKGRIRMLSYPELLLQSLADSGFVR